MNSAVMHWIPRASALLPSMHEVTVAPGGLPDYRGRFLINAVKHSAGVIEHEQVESN